MAFTYNGPGVDDVSTVRFLVGDTNANEVLLEDAEITFLITEWDSKGSLYYTASKAAESIANKFTREVPITVDGQNLDLSVLRDRFMATAGSLMLQYEDALVGGSSLYAGGMDAHESPDVTVAPLAFGRGMHDSPEVGRQDYGDISAQQSGALDFMWGEQVP